MRRAIHRGLTAATLLALLAACGTNPFAPAKTGRIGISVQWPNKKAAFTLLAIPEGTVRIVVSIRGEGIAEGAPIQTTLENRPGGGEVTGEILEVPLGSKIIEAVSYDAAGNATAVGSYVVAVQPNLIVDAPIELKPIPVESPLPTPTPSGSDDPIQPSPSPSGAGTPEPTSIIRTVAGDGVPGALDALSGLAARFHYPRSMAYSEEQSSIYIADTEQRLIRRLYLVDNSVTTFAGRPEINGLPGFGISPPLAGVDSGVPSGLVVTKAGDVYYCDRDNHMIRRITKQGVYENVAGTGRSGYLDGPVGQAQFNGPSDLTMDDLGNIYVADTLNNRVRRITGGQVTTIAGPTDRTPIQAPTSVVVEPGGKSLYIAEPARRRVVRFNYAEDGTGVITPIAGNGTEILGGDGGPALLATITLPTELELDKEGTLYITDGWEIKTRIGSEIAFRGASGRVLRLTRDGRLERVAGRGTAGRFGGDGGDAKAADLNNPSGMTFDAGGRLFIADTFSNRIRALTPLPLPPLATPTPVPPSATPEAPPSVTP